MYALPHFSGSTSRKAITLLCTLGLSSEKNECPSLPAPHITKYAQFGFDKILRSKARARILNICRRLTREVPELWDLIARTHRGVILNLEISQKQGGNRRESRSPSI
jgi:hypothetical protein